MQVARRTSQVMSVVNGKEKVIQCSSKWGGEIFLNKFDSAVSGDLFLAPSSLPVSLAEELNFNERHQSFLISLCSNWSSAQILT